VDSVALSQPQPLVCQAEAEDAAHNWASFQKQIDEIETESKNKIESLKELQSSQSAIIHAYLKDNPSLLGGRKSAEVMGVVIGTRKAQDSIELNAGVSYDSIWATVLQKLKKNKEKYPELALVVKPEELYKTKLKQLPDRLLKMLGCKRVVGKDEFFIELPSA
jgi:hypothetical protein